MASDSHRHLLQATCLIILVLHATLHVEAAKYCDSDFHLAVYRTCAAHKRNGGAPFSLNDVLTMNRLRGTVKRSVGSTLDDEAFYITNLEKRTSYEGIASYCCLHGCTDSELAVVC
nr:relaxin-like gonad-stimulating peptide [Certonardoa semiregularis]